MKPCKCLFLLSLSVVSGAAVCGAAQEAPEITSQQATVTFSSRVDLVSIPVVVHDSKGHAVGGLRQEDFRLFDQGKPQIILKFSVTQSGSAAAGAATGLRITEGTDTTPSTVSAATAKPPLPDLYVAYVFDDIHLNFENLVQVRAAAERHFESLASTARAASYTTSGRVTLDFTEDRGKLREALLRIAFGLQRGAARVRGVPAWYHRLRGRPDPEQAGYRGDGSRHSGSGKVHPGHSQTRDPGNGNSQREAGRKSY